MSIVRAEDRRASMMGLAEDTSAEATEFGRDSSWSGS